MVPVAFVRQFAVAQEIGLEVADQEIVLHYALALLDEAELIGTDSLLFKGGTALRKCVFGSTGRFSQDIDLDATRQDDFEGKVLDAFDARSPFHGITLAMDNPRHSGDGNFGAHVLYAHANGSGRFELQISYRLDPVLEPVTLTLQEQSYHRHTECGVPDLAGLNPYEMIGEKIMACNRRMGGSGKDVYDLYLWAERPFSDPLVRRLAVLKAWTDQRRSRPYDPEQLLATIQPKSFRWADLTGLVPRRRQLDAEDVCRRVRQRFGFLAETTEDEQTLLADQVSHRHRKLFDTLRAEAREWVAAR